MVSTPVRRFGSISSVIVAIAGFAFTSCTNGGITKAASKTTSAIGAPALVVPSPNTGSLTISPSVVGAFQDPSGPLGSNGKGMLLNIEEPVTDVAAFSGGLASFLSQALSDAAFGAQTLTVQLPAQNLRILIPLRNLVATTQSGSNLLYNGVILRANGKVALVHYDDMPKTSAGLKINESNRLIMYGGLRDGEGIPNVVDFSLSGGMGVLLTNNLQLPYGYLEQADETIVLPTNTSLISDAYVRGLMDSIRFDYKFLYIRDDGFCTQTSEPSLMPSAGSGDIVYKTFENPYSVMIIQRKLTDGVQKPYLVQLCGYKSGSTTYQCGVYYSIVYGETQTWNLCPNKGFYRPSAGSLAGMDNKKKGLLNPLVNHTSLKPVAQPSMNTIPGGYLSNGITVMSGI